MASTPTYQTADPTRTATEPLRGAKPDGPDRLTVMLAAAQAGSQHAFGALYHDLHPRLLRQLRFLVGHSDAPDVASETWLHITAGITNFHGTYSKFRSWAATIAQRRAIDHLRRTPPADPTSPAELPDRLAPDDTEHDALEALSTRATLATIKTLPSDQHKIILLRVIAGFDAPTTARILGKRPGAIRTGTHRALRTLGSQLPSPITAGSASARTRRIAAKQLYPETDLSG